VLGSALALLAGSAGAMLGSPAQAGVRRPVGHVYVVKAGDSLWSIAQRFAAPGDDLRASVDAIASASGISDGAVHPGQSVRVP